LNFATQNSILSHYIVQISGEGSSVSKKLIPSNHMFRDELRGIFRLLIIRASGGMANKRKELQGLEQKQNGL
jgi:hypothetical protein